MDALKSNGLPVGGTDSQRQAAFDQALVGSPTASAEEDKAFRQVEISTNYDNIPPFNYSAALTTGTAIVQRETDAGGNRYIVISDKVNSEKLLITPLAYIRGRSLGKAFFIIDEAQNLTPHEIKTIITRAGEDTKIVFTGDIFQIDQPYLDQWSNGLTHLGEKMAGQRLFEHVFLRKGERSELSEIASRLL